jgi:hypothetical protein
MKLLKYLFEALVLPSQARQQQVNQRPQYDTVFNLLMTPERGRDIARKLGFDSHYWRKAVSSNSIYLYIFNESNPRNEFEIRFSTHKNVDTRRTMGDISFLSFIKNRDRTMNVRDNLNYFDRKEWLIDEEKYKQTLNPALFSQIKHRINVELMKRKIMRENVKHNILVGKEVEKEHTNDSQHALKIAFDHVKEDKHYYKKLYKSGLIDEPKALELAKKYFGGE